MVYSNSILQKLRQLYIKDSYFEIEDFDSNEQFNFMFSEGLISQYKASGSKWLLTARAVYSYGMWSDTEAHPDGIKASVLIEPESKDQLLQVAPHQSEWLLENVADKTLKFNSGKVELVGDFVHVVLDKTSVVLFRDTYDFSYHTF